jgi:hypothetical protein
MDSAATAPSRHLPELNEEEDDDDAALQCFSWKKGVAHQPSGASAESAPDTSTVSVPLKLRISADGVQRLAAMEAPVCRTVAMAFSGSRYALKWALENFLPEGRVLFRILHVRPAITMVPTQSECSSNFSRRRACLPD